MNSIFPQPSTPSPEPEESFPPLSSAPQKEQEPLFPNEIGLPSQPIGPRMPPPRALICPAPPYDPAIG